jgi:secondary thiamine-phosphate synthase enzyme
MLTELHSFETGNRRITDLTGDVERFVAGAGSDGLVHVFAPHATAGIALIETGSGTEADLEGALDRLLPREDIYTHSHGSKGHGADHVIPAFISPSLMIPIVDGRMALGTWQSVVFVDLNRDNPQRKVRFSFIPA